MEDSRGRWLWGIVIIGIGTIALLNNFDVTDISLGTIFTTYWPVFIIILGITGMIDRRNTSGLLQGGLIALFGTALLARNLGLINFNLSWLWKAFWPLILILVGIHLFRGPSKSNVAFMGGIDKTKGRWRLEEENYTAVMGGIELDLRHATIEDRKYTIHLQAVMGGVTVIVPKDLTIICEGQTIMGGLELLGKGNGGLIASLQAEQGDPTTDTRVIYLYCKAFMGGIEVKAY